MVDGHHGVHDERYDAVDDIGRARRVPSLQLTSSPERRTLDLNALTRHRIETGSPDVAFPPARRSSQVRCTIIADGRPQMNRLLGMFDEWASATARR